MVGKRLPNRSIGLGENLVTHFPEIEALPYYATRQAISRRWAVIQLVGR
jgi:hypothetical protein